ncbi:MAG: hypothetical protein CMM54_00565 [Rhodospirillaceae bacterium]|nr:hypothetical protein [Rhodospirillaceae bacterium]
MYRTRVGDFVLSRGKERRYLRNENGGRGKHVTDWTVIAAPTGYASSTRRLKETSKSDLIREIDRALGLAVERAGDVKSLLGAEEFWVVINHQNNTINKLIEVISELTKGGR